MPQRAATRVDVCGPLGTPGGVAPALNAATDAQLVVPLEVAELRVYPPRWRLLTMHAHAYLAAHILATTPGLGLEGGNDIEELAGPVTAHADGPSSRSFGQLSAEAIPSDDAFLATTHYGRQFLELRKQQRGFGAFMTSGGSPSTWT